MSKTLLVLGAGVYQIPAIEAAKRLGYRVITTCNVSDSPAHALADQTFAVDTTDVEGVTTIAKRQQISGVIAPCTDVGVVTAAHVADRLCLPGPPLVAATILTRKYQFREWARQARFPCPRCVLARGGDVPAALFDGRRWLVKPNRSSGSKGVFIVSTHQEFLARVSESRGFSLDGLALLEEFIDGTQHTCEGILKSGRIAVALITDRDTAPPPYTATTGHRVPTRLPKSTQRSAFRMIEQALCRLGVGSGPFDCDFVATSGGIALLELTPRLGGNSLSKLFRAALSFDLTAYAVAYACGDPYPIPESLQPRSVSVIILRAEETGRLMWNSAEAHALRHEPWVEDLIFDLERGAFVERFTNGRQRVGEALVAGTGRGDLDKRVAELTRRLALHAESTATRHSGTGTY